jgi:hypothetical protein
VICRYFLNRPLVSFSSNEIKKTKRFEKFLKS